ncbi:MAG: DNA glycosylase [Promethearchaeota archaeon]
MTKKKIFTRNLLDWYATNGRMFFWRTKTDPYSVMIAEIMLQRTKANQVEKVYINFLKEFPDVRKLNDAPESKINNYINQLGLLWRTKKIKLLARKIVNNLNSKIPENREILISLPSIGNYIADSILSFAFNQDVAVIDVNVCRILMRVFGIRIKGEARKNKELRILADSLLPKGKAKKFNWAIIDLASLICVPHDPKHSICPMNKICSYYQDLLLREPRIKLPME